MRLFHFVARAVPGRRLFRTVPEARALWSGLARAFPETLALCMMPDHIHLALPHGDPAGRLAHVMSGYTRFLAHRGGPRELWAARPAPVLNEDADKIGRTIRYIHLNPTRSKLVADPLAWPWSTHRDQVGFAAFPLGKPRDDPDRFHASVSADLTVTAAGTRLPRVCFDALDWPTVRDAVLSVCRAEPKALRIRGPVRLLAARTAWIHEVRGPAVVRALAMSRGTMWRITRGLPERNGHITEPALAACVRAVGDPRLATLYAEGTGGAWGWYPDYAPPLGTPDDGPIPPWER